MFVMNSLVEPNVRRSALNRRDAHMNAEMVKNLA
jgi:hypothetical protein